MLGNETALLNQDSMYSKEMPLDLEGKVNVVAGVAVKDTIFGKVFNYAGEDSRIHNKNWNLIEKDREG
jgi:hypothetical protein